MKRHAIALAMLVASAGVASAEKLDLSTMTCGQFVSADKPVISMILTWLDGYYRDEDDPPVLDTDIFVRNAEKLGAYCGANPQIGLITAADKVFGDN